MEGQMKPKAKISALESHLGYWLRCVSNHISHAFSQKVEAKGVTVAEWVVLRTLYQAENANPSELAASLGMTRGAISKLVDRLCAKKLASKNSEGSDQRYQTIRLTSKGEKLTPLLAQLADQNEREFFGHLDSKQIADATRLMRGLVEKHGWREAPTG
jgi:DNA-binding MarR family transcriptional regulator